MDSRMSFSQYFEIWDDRELEDQAILQELQQMKIDEEEAKKVLSIYKKTKTEKRQTYGFISVAVGAFLCMISCLFTLLGILPEFRSLILYGLTSLGICIIVLGLYFIFED